MDLGVVAEFVAKRLNGSSWAFLLRHLLHMYTVSHNMILDNFQL